MEYPTSLPPKTKVSITFGWERFVGASGRVSRYENFWGFGAA